MRSYLTQRRVLVIVVLALFLSSQLPADVASRLAYVPRSALELLTRPFTHNLNRVAVWFRAPPPGYGLAGFPGRSGGAMGGEGEDEADGAEYTAAGDGMMAPHEIQELQADYARALVLIHQLEARLVEAERHIAMLSQVRQVAGDRTRSVVASIIRYNPSGRGGPTLTINRGSNSGIYPGAAVMGAYGQLVGRVAEAYATTADVRLITVPGTQVMVRITPPRPEGGPREVLEMARVSSDGRRFEVQVDRRGGPTVNPGDLAILWDEGWPVEAQGAFLGQVTDVSPLPSDPLGFNLVTIEPLRQLATLTRVAVLVPDE